MFHNKLSIFFVTNTDESLAHIRELLSRTDLGKFELQRAASGVDLTSTFAAKSHDVCIVDMIENGPGVAASLHCVNSMVPIIVLTHESANEILSSFHSGASDCLVKETLTPRELEQSLCTVIDRAQAQEWQAQYARCYLGLMENAGEIIYTHDLHGNHLSLNKAGERLTGYAAAELQRMSVRQIMTGDSLPSLWRAVSTMLASRKQEYFDAVFRRRDGSEFPVEVALHLVYKEGTPIAVQGIAREDWLSRKAHRKTRKDMRISDIRFEELRSKIG
jgi:PAS domain S-box-containing protein